MASSFIFHHHIITVSISLLKLQIYICRPATIIKKWRKNTELHKLIQNEIDIPFSAALMDNIALGSLATLIQMMLPRNTIVTWRNAIVTWRAPLSKLDEEVTGKLPGWALPSDWIE